MNVPRTAPQEWGPLAEKSGNVFVGFRNQWWALDPSIRFDDARFKQLYEILQEQMNPSAVLSFLAPSEQARFQGAAAAAPVQPLGVHSFVPPVQVAQPAMVAQPMPAPASDVRSFVTYGNGAQTQGRVMFVTPRVAPRVAQRMDDDSSSSDSDDDDDVDIESAEARHRREMIRKYGSNPQRSPRRSPRSGATQHKRKKSRSPRRSPNKRGEPKPYRPHPGTGRCSTGYKRTSNGWCVPK